MAAGNHLQVFAARRFVTTSGPLASRLQMWVREEFGAELETGEYSGLQIEWHEMLEASPACCHLEISDSARGLHTTIDYAEDASGGYVFVDDHLDSSGREGSTGASLRMPTGELLRWLSGLDGLSDAEPDLTAIVDGVLVPESPGLLLLPVESDAQGLTGAQESLRQAIDGFARCLIVTPDEASAMAARAGYSGIVQGGSVLSIARGPSGLALDAAYVGQFTLRSQGIAAARLVLRHQMAAPVRQELDRLRRHSMRRLWEQGGEELDAALQLIDEKSGLEGDLADAVNRLNAKEFELEVAWEDQVEILGQLDAAQSRVRFLERALRELGELAIQDPLPDEEYEPQTCRAAVSTARADLVYLVVSAMDEPTNALDTNPKRTLWARKIWLGLRALNDYARLKAEGRFRGSLQQYRDDGATEGVPLGLEYAPKESESTESNPDLRRMREFRVDRRVSTSGTAYMGAHVKVDRGGSGAPRIHLLDDTAGSTKKIHIGYVGPHLPTSSGF